ncbi:hypothetical protein [Streptacidiphilus sp. EB103A]|uniref:hypothetical protein n=1 Tax=Streptacidiphilus sp. EB103A TaxID=3156275 RepID=UPI003518E312
MHLLWRINFGRILPAVEVLDDGSWLSMVSTPSGRLRAVRLTVQDRRYSTAEGPRVLARAQQ